MNRASQGRGFSEEQIACLMTALGKLAFKTSPGAVPEAPEAVYGTPLEDLCKEEIAKYRRHPLDLWDRLEAWTVRNEMATGLDQFLLRHLGFFNVEPTSPGYMVRLRLPACQLRGSSPACRKNCAAGRPKAATPGEAGSGTGSALPCCIPRPPAASAATTAPACCACRAATVPSC